MEVAAVRLRPGNLFRPTKLFLPETIAYQSRSVTIKRRKWFGLGQSRADVGISQEVSVEIHSGILNASVVAQTSMRRDVDLSVSNLPKKRAEALVAEIRRGAR